MTGADDGGAMPAATDVLVVGSGIAGCAAALAAARGGADVTLATKATRPADATSHWAQGGVAVTREAPESFRGDVIDASAGTADPEAVDVLVDEAREAVADLLVDAVGVEFDPADGEQVPRDGDPNDVLVGYDYGREAAHSTRRILHVGAATGRHVLGPFLDHLDGRSTVTALTDTAALELVADEGRVRGAWLERDGAVEPVAAGATVLATGGVGDCYGRSTNPRGATGDGIAMAALAGAETEDAAYVQFHPTAADCEDPFLVSEAVRGEGALLRDGTGARFMPAVHEDAELAPRDVVARAVADVRERTGEVRLDVSPLDFEEEFPALAAECGRRGIDPGAGIPVAPSQHFLCGGVAVDDRGRTSLDRLFAVGECARTGVHGANRLASTSLLEGLVWGRRAGETAADVASVAGPGDGSDPTPIDASPPRDSDPALADGFATAKFDRLRRVMDECVGLARTEAGLDRAAAVLRRLKGEVDAYTRTRTSRDLYELRNACVCALLITEDAREAEPVGCHYLVDDGGGDRSDGRANAGGEEAERASP
jgi:L-aspartate oxidase